MPVQVFNRRKIEAYEVVEEWLLNVKEGTRPSYALSLLYYVAYTGRNPEQLIDDEIAHRETRAESPKKRDTKNSAKYRLEQFREWLLEDHPKVVLTYQQGNYGGTVKKPFRKKTRASISRIIGSVKSFYSYHDLAVGKLRRFSLGRRQWSTPFSKGDIAKAIQHADARTKALIFVAATTGRSATDLLKLRVGDINTEKYPKWGFIYRKDQVRQKTGIPMISWLTPEALYHLKEYLDTRDQPPDESFLFTDKTNNKERRLSKNGAAASLRRLSKRVFSKKADNPLTLRALRSWFGTQLDRVSYDHKQILLAHSLPYGGAYSKPKEAELFESVEMLFNEGYTQILSSTTGFDLEKIERERDELQNQFTMLTQQVQDLQREVNAKSARLQAAEQGLSRDEEQQFEQMASYLIPALESILTGDKEQAKRMLKSAKQKIASIRDNKAEEE